MKSDTRRIERIGAAVGMLTVGAVSAYGLFLVFAPEMPWIEPTIVLLSDRTTATSSTSADVASTREPPAPPLLTYLKVVDSCGVHFEGECVIVRSAPDTESDAVTRLRTGVLVPSGGLVRATSGDWYSVVFDEPLRYPERLTTEWYVSADLVEEVMHAGEEVASSSDMGTTSKRIVVDRSDQTLEAYDGETLVYSYSVSTGLSSTPTPRGWFRVFKKMPSRYMQGPIYGLTFKYYDLPGVPWNLYFTEQGAVIHGTYWHDKFGQQYSNGCVNLAPENARELYEWADLGTHVVVQD